MKYINKFKMALITSLEPKEVEKESLKPKLEAENTESIETETITLKPVVDTEESVPVEKMMSPVSSGAKEESQPESSTEVENEDKSESILEKIDDGLKEIDTPGEYVVVTLIALLLGIIVGLILSSL